MTKLKIVSVLAGVAMLATPFAAMAATFSNPVFSNGDTTIDATGQSTVSGSVTLQTGINETCEVVRTQADPSQPITDNSVGGPLGDQFGTYNVQFTVKAPPNTGTYYPTIQCAGIWGGNRSVDGNDGVVAGPSNLGTLRVTTGATGGSTVGGAFGFSSFTDFVTALKAALGIGAASAKPAGCDGVVAFNGSNAWQAQASLFAVSAGQAVFNANGVFAPTGNFKSISAQAAAAVTAACK